MSWRRERLQDHRGDGCHGGQRGYKTTEVTDVMEDREATRPQR